MRWRFTFLTTASLSGCAFRSDATRRRFVCWLVVNTFGFRFPNEVYYTWYNYHATSQHWLTLDRIHMSSVFISITIRCIENSICNTLRTHDYTRASSILDSLFKTHLARIFNTTSTIMFIVVITPLTANTMRVFGTRLYFPLRTELNGILWATATVCVCPMVIRAGFWDWLWRITVVTNNVTCLPTVGILMFKRSHDPYDVVVDHFRLHVYR